MLFYYFSTSDFNNELMYQDNAAVAFLLMLYCVKLRPAMSQGGQKIQQMRENTRFAAPVRFEIIILAQISATIFDQAL